MKKEQCGNCKFYDVSDDDQGACLRYPPVIFAVEKNLTFGFPMVPESRWCGEWKQRPARKAECAAKKRAKK